MNQNNAQWLAMELLSPNLLGVFAFVALALAMVGIYGVMSEAVTQQTKKIGVCLIEGATWRDVMGMVLWQGLKLALHGAIIGLASALLIVRWVKVMRIGAEPTDPLIFAGVTILFGIIAYFAWLSPSRQAARFDSVIALRYE